VAIRPIVKLGIPILRQVAATLDQAAITSVDTNRLIEDMIETMIDANGIGIAAPQVNVGLQIAIINAKDRPFAIINPVVTKHSLRKTKMEEGCLSIPGVFGIVERPMSVTIEYSDTTGQRIREHATGMLARVFQHEIDHLNGILFIDRAKTITQGSLT